MKCLNQYAKNKFKVFLFDCLTILGLLVVVILAICALLGAMMLVTVIFGEATFASILANSPGAAYAGFIGMGVLAVVGTYLSYKFYRFIADNLEECN